MSISELPTLRGSSLSSRGSMRTAGSRGGMTAEEMTNPGNQMIKSVSQIESDLKRINVNFERPDPSKNFIENYKIMNTYDESIGRQMAPQPIPQPEEEEMRPISSQMSQNRPPPSHYTMDNQSMMPKEFPQEEYEAAEMYQKKQLEETVVPMHNKDPIDFSKVKDEAKEDDQLGGENEEEKFNSQDKAKIDIMKQYFSEETTKLLYSKKWQNRKVGLENFISEIPKSLKEHGIVAQEHVISVFMNGCKEKLKQLSELTLELFEVLLEESKSANLELKFDSSKVNQMIVEILDKRALDIIKNKILTGGYFDFNQVASFILNERSYKNRNFMSSDVHIIARLELMYFMIENSESHTSKKPFPLNEILDYAINKLSHPKKGIREKSQEIIVQMYQKSGWYALESQISRSVPQNQLQNLLKDIPEVESLIKKKDVNKASESLREALKAVKEASQSVQKVDENAKKDNKK